jgi:signal transduction histidine kinase
MLDVLGGVTWQHDLSLAVLAVLLCLFACLIALSLVRHARALTEVKSLRAHVVDLEAAQEKLEQTSESLKLALGAASAANLAKSAFLAAMSHELRTPLNAVIGFSDMMQSETFGPLGSDRNREYVRDIHASGVHLLKLINDVLDLARIDAGEGRLHEEIVDPQEIATDCLRMVTPQATAAGIHLVRDVEKDLPMLRADERRLKQVLINLLGNAVKFTGPTGKVCLRIRQNQHGFAISVSDTGIGMAQKDIPIALEPFGQVDSTLARKYEGAGLGLPIAKQLAELHGGTLAIESALGAGTTVTVFLPASRFVERPVPVAARA